MESPSLPSTIPLVHRIEALRIFEPALFASPCEPLADRFMRDAVLPCELPEAGSCPCPLQGSCDAFWTSAWEM